MQYCGWVPNVTGHLSFTTIGLATYPARSLCIKDPLSLCVYQKRDLLDIVAPYLDSSDVGKWAREYLANYIVGVSGKFVFVCDAAHTEDNTRLVGSIFLISVARERSAVRELRSCFDTTSSIQSDISETRAHIRNLCRSATIAEARFELERAGRIFLDLHLSSEQSRSVEKIVANQFFYFFKDIAHVHQHHNPSHDSITEVAAFVEDDPEYWIRQTQHALYRAVIRYKRFRAEKELFRASGILAYAKSFESSYCSAANTTRLFHNTELEGSLDVARSEVMHEDQMRISRLQTTLSTFFAFFGAVVSAVLLARLNPDFEVEPPIFVSDAMVLVIQNPIQALAVVAVVAKIMAWWTHKNDPATLRIPRATLRWMQGFRLRWYVLTNVILTIIFSAICYVLLISTFFN